MKGNRHMTTANATSYEEALAIVEAKRAEDAKPKEPSFEDVLHRIVDNIRWHEESTRDEVHRVIAKHFEENDKPQQAEDKPVEVPAPVHEDTAPTTHEETSN